MLRIHWAHIQAQEENEGNITLNQNLLHNPWTAASQGSNTAALDHTPCY